MKQSIKRIQTQLGGTTLGIIVGVVLGLLVALGVSLYIAHSSAPVQNKAANPAARIEPPADLTKAPDPNQSLYTKVPKVDEAKASEAKEVKEAKEAVSEVKNAPPIASSQAPAPVAATANKSAEQDGVGKIAAIVTPAKPAVAPPAATTQASIPALTAAPALSKSSEVIVMPKPASVASGERYFVQAGAFANVNEANALKAKIALMGAEMGLSPREKDGQILLRVRTAPLAAADAERLRNTLKANGIETSLVKVQ
jgi:cell division protein FtsN